MIKKLRGENTMSDKTKKNLIKKKKILSAYATNAVTSTNIEKQVSQSDTVIDAKKWVDENHL